jgi:septal ring factor EnvC (AmiA/AmiB activator)
MECLFAGFDYSVKDTSGQTKVVARSEDSAFLTKHLRAYGGTGEYEGYQIGRLLRDISFSGKGLVSRPANPRSIILDSSKAFSVNEEQTISNVSEGEVNMSENIEEKQLDTAPVVEEAVQVVAEEVKIENNTSELEAALAAKDTEIQAYASKVATLEETLANLEKELAGLNDQMKNMKKKEKDRDRKGQLVSAGFEEAEADEVLPLHDALDDSAFEAIVAVYKKKMVAKKETKKDMEEDKKDNSVDEEKEVSSKASESEVTEQLFEEVKTTEATLVAASDEGEEIESTRASVAEWLTNNVLRNK